MEQVGRVQEYYNNDVANEWLRLERHVIEYEINKRYMEKYIHAGDKVLDIGGGPGRYSLHLAGMGCKVTLLDLSQGNVALAREKAMELGLKMEAVCGDARYADTQVAGPFDAILLMGPLYHLPEEKDRKMAVEAALKLLKPGGFLFVAFISSYAAVWDYLTNLPQTILDAEEKQYYDLFANDESFSGFSFTETHFIRPGEVSAFMASFPLTQLHLLGSESILATREKEIMAQPPEVLSAWIDFAQKVCERKEALGMAHHLLYIGKKQ